MNTFQQVVEMIDKEYDSPVRQNRVKNHVNGLRLSKFTNQGLGESTAFEKVYKLINKLAPQVSQSEDLLTKSSSYEMLPSVSPGLLSH